MKDHPDAERDWFESSNCLALLSVGDEAELSALAEAASRRGIRTAGFREPDLGGSLTAIAMEPSARKMCGRLKLALSA